VSSAFRGKGTEKRLLMDALYEFSCTAGGTRIRGAVVDAIDAQQSRFT